jgi:hypothetical protein
MSKKDWFHSLEISYREVNDLINNETNSPKNGGFLKKFHYNNLGKFRSKYYDILKEKYEGVNLTNNVFQKMTDEDKFNVINLLVNCYKNLSFDDYVELENYYYNRGEQSEDPENIYYNKEKFELI